MSVMQDAWERADFKEVAAIARRRSKGTKNKWVAESHAALKLEELVRSSNSFVFKKANSPEPLKVVTILHSSLPTHTGGYTGRAHGLLAGLKRLGVEIVGYTRPGFLAETKAENPKAEYNIDGIIYRNTDSTRQRAKGEYQYMLSCIEQYEAIFMRERPDVVHARSTYLIALPAIIAAHNLGIPAVYEVSGLWELVYRGRGDVGRAKRTEFLENLTCLAADRVVTMNDSMAELLKSRSETSLEVGLVPNAVNPERFEGVTPLVELGDAAYDVGYIGSMVDYEGLDLLLEAIATLRAKGRVVTAKIVGDGTMRRTMEEKAQSLGVFDQVLFRGAVPAKDAVNEFQNIRTIVLPRKSTPATEIVTPLKPFEAMAAGRPLLVSDVNALAELSKDGQYAWTFEKDDSQSLADALERLLDDEASQKGLVSNCHSLIEEKHGWDLVAKMMRDELAETARIVAGLNRVRISPNTYRTGKLSISFPQP